MRWNIVAGDKFSYCVSNPPYQLTVATRAGHSDHTIDIFTEFQQLGSKIARQTAMIYPYGRWWIRPSVFKDWFIEQGKLNSLFYFSGTEALEVFPHAGINDGVCIAIAGEEANDLLWGSAMTEGSSLVQRNQILPIMPQASRVFELLIKIKNNSPSMLPDRDQIRRNSAGLLGSEMAALQLTAVEESYEPQPHELKIYGNPSSSKGAKSGFYAIDKSLVPSNPQWKVCFGQSIVENEDRQLRLFLFDPLTEYGRSAVSLAVFPQREEAVRFKSYAATKFFEFLFRTTISGRKIATFVPDLEDYTAANPLFQSDEELGEDHPYHGLDLNRRLYILFQLTDEEIQVVEANTQR